MAEVKEQLNRGVLFTNKKKETEKHPDYTGSFTNESGKEFWVSAWINESKSGAKYMSFTTKAKDEQPASKPKSESKWSSPKDDNDDLPF